MLNKNHKYQMHHYDKQSKPFAPLEIEDSVRFQQYDKSWKTVLSNIVNAPNVDTYCRNMRYLMKTNEQTYTFDLNLPVNSVRYH